MFKFGFVILVCMCQVDSSEGWLNTYDHCLSFNCLNTQSINYVKSQHNNYYQDRQFDMGCKYIVPNATKYTGVNCYGTGWKNNYDQLLSFQCPSKFYISGMVSEHDNHAEDRRWKFTCCAVNGIQMTNCYGTGWTNSYDGPQNFSVPSGQVMKGVTSIHDNHREDRIYKYVLCSPAYV